MTDKAYL